MIPFVSRSEWPHRSGTTAPGLLLHFFLFPKTLLTQNAHCNLPPSVFLFQLNFFSFSIMPVSIAMTFFYTSPFRPFPGEKCYTPDSRGLVRILIKDNIRCWANVRSTSTIWRWDYWNCLADILHLYGQPKVVCNMCPCRHLHVYEFSDPLVHQTYTWPNVCRQK